MLQTLQSSFQKQTSVPTQTLVKLVPNSPLLPMWPYIEEDVELMWKAKLTKGDGPIASLTSVQRNIINNWPLRNAIPFKYRSDIPKLLPFLELGIQPQREPKSDPGLASLDLSYYLPRDLLLVSDQELDKGLNFGEQKCIPPSRQQPQAHTRPTNEILQELDRNQTLSKEILLRNDSKFFVIKSYNEQDIIAAVKHQCWSSTRLGNKRLNKLFVENGGKNVFLFFSVNSSGKFCAVAEMMGPVDFEKDEKCWSDPKWKGSFPVRFIFVRDVENKHFKSINIQMVKNGVHCYASVITSRDTQPLPTEVGFRMINIFAYSNSTPSSSTLISLMNEPS